MQAVKTADPSGRILQLIFALTLLCFSEQVFGKTCSVPGNRLFNSPLAIGYSQFTIVNCELRIVNCEL